MSYPEKASKRKRRNKTLPVLGAAGLSLSVVSGASATTVPSGTEISRGSTHITLTEEEIADVSLATLYVFDKETSPSIRLAATVQARCGRCGRCGGAGRCGGRCAATTHGGTTVQTPATKSRKSR